MTFLPKTDLSEEFSIFLIEVLTASTNEARQAKKTIFRRSIKDYLTFTIAESQAVIQKSFSDKNHPKELLQKFSEAHFSHAPENRMANKLSTLKVSALLQPTAKGLAVLQKWYFINGKVAIKSPESQTIVVNALESNYNTMQSIESERSLLGRKILVSTGVVMLLWVKMLGRDPHLYDLSNLESTFGGPSTCRGVNKLIYAGVDGKPGPANIVRRPHWSEVFNPNMLSSKNVFHGSTKAGKKQPSAEAGPSTLETERNVVFPKTKQGLSISSDEDYPTEAENDYPSTLWDTTFITPTRDDEKDQRIVSPYYHRSMVHPNSSTMMQYWDSRGIRMFKNVNFDHSPDTRFGKTKSSTVELVSSGNAILQWIMDCTNVECSEEGISIATLFYKNCLIKPIDGTVMDLIAIPSNNVGRSPRIPNELSTHFLYRITPRGLHLSMWNDEMSDYILDPMDIQKEIDEKSKRLNQYASSTNSNIHDDSSEDDTSFASRQRASLFNPKTWEWEHHLPNGVSQRFLQMIDFPLICREPALKMSFRREVFKSQCAENLMCADQCQHLLLLVGAYKDAASSVTRRQHLEHELFNSSDGLETHFLKKGGSFELNIDLVQRKALLHALDFKRYTNMSVAEFCEKIEAPIMESKTIVSDLLRDAVSQFANGESVYGVPGLRSYVVARHS